MAVSIQKIIAMTLSMKVIFAILILINNVTAVSENAQSIQISQGEETLYSFQNDVPNANTESSTTILQQSYGDVRLSQQLTFFTLLKAGWGWISYSIYDDGSLERVAAVTLNWFFTVVNLLLALEITFLIYSRKWT